MLFVHVSGGLVVWFWVGCLCPPVRNDTVTPRHLFFPLSPFCLSFTAASSVDSVHLIKKMAAKDFQKNYSMSGPRSQLLDTLKGERGFCLLLTGLVHWIRMNGKQTQT